MNYAGDNNSSGSKVTVSGENSRYLLLAFVTVIRFHNFVWISLSVREVPVLTSDRMTGKIIARRIKPTIRLSFVARKWRCTPDALAKDVTPSLSRTPRRDNLSWLFAPVGIPRASGCNNQRYVYSDVNTSRVAIQATYLANIWDSLPSPARRSFGDDTTSAFICHRSRFVR